ncbi:MAG TPA: LLM class F420-dependent oxidoreductase [bacterium]|jgi:probable F420-dependent oxidoreductase|nr:LLM class F420-dependent oxidoreductase [bacterium]
MKIGVVFPQIESGTDPGFIRDYAQTAESLGYDHILIYDHVVGANTASRPKWSGPYTSKNTFHEPFVVFGYMAACTQRIELATGVIILPQRQAVLVAKQAAEVDVLSGGRLRLGIGVGWNDVEFDALGTNFHDRGARCVEQMKVMRALWTQETVTFEGKWHRIPDAGINPLPVQRPIPLWIGGESEIALRRAARIADGWMSSRPIRPAGKQPAGEPAREHQVERLREHLAAAGRSPKTFGIEGRAAIADGGPDQWRLQIEQWQKLGATHLSVNTMQAGLPNPRAHIDAITRFREATR